MYQTWVIHDTMEECWHDTFFYCLVQNLINVQRTRWFTLMEKGQKVNLTSNMP